MVLALELAVASVQLLCLGMVADSVAQMRFDAHAGRGDAHVREVINRESASRLPEVVPTVVEHQ